MLVAETALQGDTVRLGLFAGGVVGSNQQVPDCGTGWLPQCRYGHQCRKAAAVLADVSQFVDVLNAPRRLEDHRLEAGRDFHAQFGTEEFRARQQFARIGEVRRRHPVDDVVFGIAKHPLRANVEDLDDALAVGGDAGEVGTFDDGVLQCACGQDRGICCCGRGCGLGCGLVGGGDCDRAGVPRTCGILLLGHSAGSSLGWIGPEALS